MENKEVTQNLDAALPDEAAAPESVVENPAGVTPEEQEVQPEAVAEENAEAGSDAVPEDGAEEGGDAPESEKDDEGEDKPERSYDISEDGSPHGPLNLFSDDPEEEQRLNSGDAPALDEMPEEKNVPTFAAFHSPDTHIEETKPEKPEDDEEDEEEDEFDEGEAPMTLMGHLNELRRRLFRIVIIVILGFVAFYGVAEPIYGYLSAPLKAQLPEGSKLIYTSPAGAFFTYMKVALVASLFGTSPFSFYQLWAFIAPGLYKEEKRAVLPLAFFSSIFFIAGAAFCFFLVFPIAFKFFMGFATDTIVPMISVEEYLGFALKLLIAFGVVFEMPLFAYFLSRFGILSPDFMRRQRRYAILFIFIIAAILTPPDVFSQCLMAMPMLLLYEVSIYVSAVAYKKKDTKAEETEDDDEEAEESKEEA